ncbi:MAG: hypothetical protein K8F91_07030 [Candidatus Obscuribacterales bacterium]|nr:hypothetical protein [Candidatus Obscuribacterales bacterium]
MTALQSPYKDLRISERLTDRHCRSEQSSQLLMKVLILVAVSIIVLYLCLISESKTSPLNPYQGICQYTGHSINLNYS